MTPKNSIYSEFSDMEAFKEELMVILVTTSDNEFKAVHMEMDAPHKMFVHDTGSIVSGSIGMFGCNKAVLIQMKAMKSQRDAIESVIKLFPNAKYIIGVGAGFAFDRSKYKLGDVLVSNAIMFENDVTHIDKELKKIFCSDPSLTDFSVSEDGRKCKLHSGMIVSSAHPMDTCKKFQAKLAEVIGVEMGCGELVEIQQRHRNIRGVISIRGVSNYADSTMTNSWEITAIMAAVNYTKKKLNSCALQGLLNLFAYLCLLTRS